MLDKIAGALIAVQVGLSVAIPLVAIAIRIGEIQIDPEIERRMVDLGLGMFVVLTFLLVLTAFIDSRR